jgi:dTDP-4-dehydrorhamnose reductase
MKKNRVLLTGCHGLLGQWIVQEMKKNVCMLGIDRHDNPHIHGDNFQYTQLDITVRSDVKHVFEEFNPDVIINAASFTNVDECETKKEECWRINVEGVENIVKAGKRLKAKVIHFSTDYVFDGQKEMYTERDFPAPLNYYGRAKLAADNLIMGGGTDWAILRTSTLFDIDSLLGKIDFVTWVINELQQGNSIRVVSDQWGNPTLARNLAQAVWKIIDNGHVGIYNAAGKDTVSRFDFAKRIAAIFNLNELLIEETTTEELGQKAKRPLKIGLNISKIEKDVSMKMLGIRESLVLFKQDFLEMHPIN